MRRLLVLVALVSGLVVLPSARSLACSCAAIEDVRAAVLESDGAFVGALLHREEPEAPGGLFRSDEVVTWTFEVHRVLRGTLGSTVDVESPLSDVSCGLLVDLGERAGLLLSRVGGEWQSSLCQQVDPEIMIRMSGFFPAPESPVAATPKGFVRADPPSTMQGIGLAVFLLTTAGIAGGLWIMRRRGRAEGH
jgi:hypothetical protein